MKWRAAEGAGEGLWLRAERQTGGIGRLGRKWESPKGNLYCSTLVDIGKSDPPPSSLSFVTALAVYDSFRAFLPDADIMLKWPNDLLVSGAKICGILLEATGSKVVVGIGVNVAVTPPVDGRKVSSMHQEGASDCDASSLLTVLSEDFAKWVGFWRSAGLAAILNEWQKYAHPAGSTITTSDTNGEKVSGEYVGLAEDGALRLRKADGTLIELRAGDIEVG